VITAYNRAETKETRAGKIRRFFSTLVILFFFFSSLFIATFAHAQETKDPIIVNGDKVEYLYEQKKVVGVNNIVITYKDVKLTCDMIVVHMETKEAEAEGNVVLTQKGSIFRGEKVHYNFETQKGTIIEAEARREPWYAKGETASKVADKEYLFDRGHITTCNLPYPHYRIQARRIKIFIDDKVEAYHVFVFVGKCPIFYFPYYIHPLKDKRPRVTIVPGRNSKWGYFLLTAWRYYFHEWSRGYVHLDWREKKGFAEGIDYKYKLGYFGKGLARFYYTKEGEHLITTEENETGQSIGDDRWRFQLRHKWQMDKDTTAIGEFHKLSDKLFIKDYFFNEEFEEDEQPETYFSIIRTRPKYNLTLFFRKRMHDFFTVTEKLPEMAMDVKNQRLRDTDFYYKSTTSFVMLQKRFEDSILNPNLKANRFDTSHELSYLTKVFGFLTFNPFVNIRETWYSEDAMDKKNKLRHVYTLGTNFSTKFYRVFPVQTDLLGLDINSLKHIITPSLTYSYRPTPNIKSAGLKQFDEVDEVSYHHGVSLEIVNRLQTKRGDTIVNLARFTTSSQLFLRPEGNKTLDDVKFDLELNPYPWLVIDVDSAYSPKRGKIETVNADIVAKKEDLWRLGFGYRFEEGTLDNSNSQITADASYRLSPKWKLKAYHRYKKDPERNSFEIEEQNYAIERDLHCWLAELNYQFKQTDGLEVDEEHRFWLVMRLKAFPGLPFKMFSASFSAPRAGVRTEDSD